MSGRKRRTSLLPLGWLLLALALAGCAIPLAPPRAPVAEPARQALARLIERWHEFSDLRALADITLQRGGERQRLTGVLLARAPASVRFEALSPFGQPFLVVTIHEGRLTAYDVAANEALVGAATAETAARLLSLPFEPDDVVAVLSGRAVPPRDLRIAELLPADERGPSLELVGRFNRQRVWIDLESGVARQLEIGGGRLEARVTYRRDGDGHLTGFDLTAAQGHVTGAVHYRSLVVGAGVEPERFTLTIPKGAKIQPIR